MRLGVPLAVGIVADTPARLIVPWYAGQLAPPAAAPEDAGAAAEGPAPDDTAPGAVVAGVAGPDPEQADSVRITIAAATGAICRERISASVPPAMSPGYQ
jgi:hypothetical protein